MVSISTSSTVFNEEIIETKATCACCSAFMVHPVRYALLSIYLSLVRLLLGSCLVTTLAKGATKLVCCRSCWWMGRSNLRTSTISTGSPRGFCKYQNVIQIQISPTHLIFVVVFFVAPFFSRPLPPPPSSCGSSVLLLSQQQKQTPKTIPSCSLCWTLPPLWSNRPSTRKRESSWIAAAIRTRDNRIVLAQ